MKKRFDKELFEVIALMFKANPDFQTISVSVAYKKSKSKYFQDRPGKKIDGLVFNKKDLKKIEAFIKHSKEVKKL